MPVLITSASAGVQKAVGQSTDVSQILEEAGAIVDVIPDHGEVEEHYPVRRWKVEFFSDLARIQAKAGDRKGLSKSAQQAVKSAQRSPFLILTLSTIARTQIDSGDRVGADATLKEMLLAAEAIDTLSGVVNKEGLKDSALSLTASIQSGVEGAQQVRNTIDGIKDDRERADAQINLASALVKGGDRNGASTLLRQVMQQAQDLRDADDRAWLLVQVAEVQVGAGDRIDALRMVAQLQDAIRVVEDNMDRSSLLLRMARVQTAMGDLDVAQDSFAGALRAAHAITSDSGRIEQFGYLAMSRDRAGDHTSVLAMLQDALNIANGITDPSSKSDNLQRIASNYASLGENSRAEEIVTQALNVAGQIESASSRSFAVFEIAFVLSQLGDADGLHRAIGMLKVGDNSTPYVLSELVRAEAGQGDIDPAIQTNETLRNMQKIVQASAGVQWITAARVRRDGVPAALAWAKGRSSPYDRARALLGVAQGIMENNGKK
ncbi:MAG TPA: hypothetical protein VEH02_02800 [Pseudolabrys sp.]|nr:hypothetical protein [Pseudolabrys sp.]